MKGKDKKEYKTIPFGCPPEIKVMVGSYNRVIKKQQKSKKS